MKAYIYKTSIPFRGSNNSEAFEVIRGQPGGIGELPEPLGFQEDLEVCIIKDLGGGNYSVTVDQAAYEAREAAKAEAIMSRQAQIENLAWVVKRTKGYTARLNKTPIPGQSELQAQLQAIGHTLDALLEYLSTRDDLTPELLQILEERAEVKEEFPKP